MQLIRLANNVMRFQDLLIFTYQSLSRYRFRSAMVLLSIVMGVSSVIVLTAIGEGARQYVINEFSFLGKDTLVLFPGKTETVGGLPPVTGTASREITLNDVSVLESRVPGINAVAPIVLGSISASYDSLSRDAITIGTNHAFFNIRKLHVSQGSALPEMDNDVSKNVCVIGYKLKKELFHEKRALGEWLRIADRRYRIIGVLGSKGDAFGMDLSDAIFIPVASAQSLFNISGLFRVLIKIDGPQESIEKQILDIMTERHGGDQDVTIINPDALLGTFNEILTTLTIAVSAIASISLLVAGVLIMNMTLIAINQRVNEIGLLKALGAPPGQIRRLFLTETIVLCIVGASAGVLVGNSLVWAGTVIFPGVPFDTPLWATASAVIIAIFTGIIFSYLPAQKAAKMNPVENLLKP